MCERLENRLFVFKNNVQTPNSAPLPLPSELRGIALTCEITVAQVTVVDKSAERVAAWNSNDLPIYEPGLQGNQKMLNLPFIVRISVTQAKTR